MEHKLKILPQYFKAVQSGEKTFELRKNDRGFKVGDTLILQEFERGAENFIDLRIKTGYTGNEITKQVSYILEGGQYGLEEGYCILGLKQELKDVFINIVEFQNHNLKGIPIPCIFSSYENLTKFEGEIMYRKDVKTLNVTRCKIDEHLRVRINK